MGLILNRVSTWLITRCFVVLKRQAELEGRHSQAELGNEKQGYQHNEGGIGVEIGVNGLGSSSLHTSRR